MGLLLILFVAFLATTFSKFLSNLYYKKCYHLEIVDEIGVFRNDSYEMLRKLQTPSLTKEEFLTQNKEFLAAFVSMAERFIYDLREVHNLVLQIEKLREDYMEWIRSVQKKSGY